MLLAAACTAPAAAQTGALRIDAGMHTQPISGLAADRQGRWVATISSDQTLKVWDAQSLRLERSVVLAAQAGPDGTPTAIAMSPDGRTVVLAGRGLPLQLVDRSSGEVRLVGAPLDERPVELVWAPDGRTIAALLGARGGVRLFEAATLKPLGGLPNEAVIGMDLGSDGRLLAYLFDGSLRLFDTRGGSGGWAQTAAVKLSDYWRGYKDPKPGERRSGWDEPGPGVVRISPDGRHAAIARVGLLRIAIVALPTLEAVDVVAPPDRSRGVFGPLAWKADSSEVLFVGGDWPSAGRDELGFISLARDADRHARAPARTWRHWSPEGVAGDRTPMPAPSYVQTVPQGFVFATLEPSWGVFRTDQPRSQRVERVTLSLAAATSTGSQPVDAAGHPLFMLESAKENWQPASLDLDRLELKTLNRNSLDRRAAEGSGTRWDRETRQLWRDDGTGRKLWNVDLPAMPLAVTTRAAQDGSGFVAARLVDGSWRWYRYADGAELLALFIHRDASRWVAWTPAGETAGEAALLRRTVPRGGAFALADARSELKAQPQAIARALQTPAASPVLAAAPAGAATLTVVSPLSGSAPGRDLVTLTVRVPREPALQAIDVRFDDRLAGRVDVAQMQRVEAAGAAEPQFRFDVRMPFAAARIGLSAQFAGGTPRAETAITLGKPRSNSLEYSDRTFFNPLTRDLRACAARSVPLDEVAQQLRKQVDAAVAKYIVPNGHSSVETVYPIEIDVGLALLYADRPQEAEAWARERLATELMKIPRNVDDWPNRKALATRRIALMGLLGRALQTRNPPEAERWLKAAHEAQLEQWAPQSLGCSNTADANRPETYCGSLRGRLIARHRAQLWGDFHESAGRLAEARDLFDATARAFNEGYGPQPKEGETYRARAEELEAQLALRDGSLTPALRTAMLKAPTPAVVTALARANLPEDARKAAATLAAGFEKRLPTVFETRRDSSSPLKPVVNAGADACPVHFDPAPRQPGYSQSVVEPLRRAWTEADLGSRIALAQLAAGDADGAYRSAEATYAAADAYFGASHPLTLQAQATLARVQAARGRAAEALGLWRPWAAKFNAAIGDQLWGLGEDARRALLRPARANVEALYASLAQASRDGTLRPDDVDLAAAVALASRGLLTRTAAEVNQLARSRGDPASRQTVEQLDAVRRELASLAQRPGGGAGGDSAAVASARARRDELESKLAAQLQGRRSAERVTPAAVGAALGSGDSLVEFLAFRAGDGAAAGSARAGLLALVSRAGGKQRQLVAYADMAPIERSLAEYRRAVEPQGDKAGRATRLRQSAQTLHTALWVPLAPHLQGSQRVYVVPDGLVATVPLHALLSPAGEPLASTTDLRVLNAPQSLLERGGAPGGRSLVVGGPDFGGNPKRGAGSDRAVTAGSRLQDLWFAPLPGALAEAATVGKLLQPGGGATVLTGAQATKQGVFAATAPRVMHLATHGYFLDDVRALDDDEDPLQALALSGLALRNANAALTGPATRASGEGLLTALEVTALDLRRTQLVVLSACETGLGRFQNGEGVLGLTRAFHEAGARFVLSTLWSIDDEGTKAFMDAFYAEIAAGRSPAEALNAARQGFLRHPRFSDPYYWAPFVLTGG